MILLIPDLKIRNPWQFEQPFIHSESLADFNIPINDYFLNEALSSPLVELLRISLPSNYISVRRQFIKTL